MLLDVPQPGGGEYRVHKKCGNAFNKTNCIDILKEHGVDTVLITGYCAEQCVLSAYRGALDHDLLPVILKNGLASGSRENKRFVEEISNLITFPVLRKLMEEE